MHAVLEHQPQQSRAPILAVNGADGSQRQPPNTPRRGAIPTPKAVIEEATPFIPGAPPPKTPKPRPK